MGLLVKMRSASFLAGSSFCAYPRGTKSAQLREISRACGKTSPGDRFKRLEQFQPLASSNPSMDHSENDNYDPCESNGLESIEQKFYKSSSWSGDEDKQELLKGDSEERSYKLRNFESISFYRTMQDMAEYSQCLVPPLDKVESRPLDKLKIYNLLRKNWRGAELGELMEALGYICHVSKHAVHVDKYSSLLEGINCALERSPEDKEASIDFLCQLTYLDWVLLRNPKHSFRYSHGLNSYCRALLPHLLPDEICRVFHCYRLIGQATHPWPGSFPQLALDSLARKLPNLQKHHLVQLCYFMSVCRRRIFDMTLLQECIERYLDKMTGGELAMATLAFFKTNTRITKKQILYSAMKKAKLKTKRMDDASLTMIWKTLRYHHISVNKPIFLSSLQSIELEKLSTAPFGHLLHYGTVYNYYHETLMREIRNRVSKEAERIRLKDIGKLMIYVSRIGYQSEHAADIIDIVRRHLLATYNTGRSSEIARYPMALAHCLVSFACMGTYEKSLLDVLLNDSLIRQSCRDNSMSWELWFLDRSAVIDLPGYESKFSEHCRECLAKWYAEESIPTLKRHCAAQFIMTVTSTLKRIFACDSCIRVTRVLPQYTQGNIIICLDRTRRRGVPIKSDFVREPVTEPRYLGEQDFNEDTIWLACELLGTRKLIFPNYQPNGLAAKKLLHLRSLGYIPFVLTEVDWLKNTTERERVSYMRKILGNVMRAQSGEA